MPIHIPRFLIHIYFHLKGGETNGFDRCNGSAQRYTEDLSPVLYNYYQNLQKQGFSKEEAFQIVLELQRSLMSFRG
jgi:hypothetical protein